MNQYLLQNGPNTSFSKVIKGEIHNVLATLKSSKQTSFLVSSLRQLNEDLTLLELHRSRSKPEIIDCMLYLPPFCTAVSSPEIGAAVTGACLGSIHKFLLYGFIDPSTVRDAKDGIASIASCIRRCSFEETDANQRMKKRISRESRNAASKLTMDRSTNTKNFGNVNMTSSTIEITDEEVVLKLLNLASLTIRSPAGMYLLEPSETVGIFDTCLHVATQVEDKASGLLKSAAADCLAAIVLVVFGTMSISRKDSSIQIQNLEHMDDSKHSSSDSQGSDDLWGESDPSLDLSASSKTTKTILLSNDFSQLKSNLDQDREPAYVTIMGRLADLIDPSSNSDRVISQALRFINIALETASTEVLSSYPELLVIMKNKLCKHLLYLSTTQDLVILCQVGRTIFNLFNSIKHHLKVQLEVFLTSLHLRILDSNNATVTSEEQKEIALESLLEFCHEPSLMSDLYVNYDCDVQCSNLFENICRAFIAIVSTENEFSDEDNSTSLEDQTPSNLQNAACEGILIIIDSIARRCDLQSLGSWGKQLSFTSECSRGSDTCNETDSSDDVESISDSVVEEGLSSPPHSGDIPSLIEDARLQASQIFLERKQKKVKVAKVTSKFNKKPFGKDWITIGEKSGVFPNPATPRSVAQFLYSTPNLDKSHIGEYISKGPVEKYTFNKQVLDIFVSLFDFTGQTFSGALRAFLLKFRLPGEAQCIDRLMEAFANQLFLQQSKHLVDFKNSSTSNHEDDDAKDKEIELNQDEPLFKNSDGIYVLAFSTIMLNTDLHNPMIKDDRRMTVDEFIRNNRGINDGSDFPSSFMEELYHQIKDNEIQVQSDLSEDIALHQWEGILKTKSKEVAAPVFTNYEVSFEDSYLAGVHERDMFLAVAEPALHSISSMFVRTKDKAFMGKLVNGIRQIATSSIYFDLHDLYNDALIILLEFGKDYIVDVMSLALKDISDEKIRTNECANPCSEANYPFSLWNIEEKGLVALESAFELITSTPYCAQVLREALPLLVECLCLLRDADVLPLQFSELDDFVNTDGAKFELSPYAYRSFCRAQRHYAHTLGENEIDMDKNSWSISSLFKAATKPSKIHQNLLDEDVSLNEWMDHLQGSCKFIKNQSAIEELKDIEEFNKLDHILLRRQDKDHAKQILCALLEETRRKGGSDLIFEHNAAYCLELASRLLFNNMEFAQDLYPLFINRFEDSVHITNGEKNPMYPFLAERVVVTILRCSIHMIDRVEMRHLLLSSLSLIQGLSPEFLCHFNDRLARGIAVLLHSALSHLTEVHEWQLLGRLIELSEATNDRCIFIYDGVISCSKIILHQNEQQVSLGIASHHAVSFLIRILLKFISNVYKTSLLSVIEAVTWIEKLYPHMCQLSQNYFILKENIWQPDEELWCSVCKIFYSVSLVENENNSEYAITALEGFVLSNHTDETSIPSWFSLLYSILNVKNVSTHEIVRVKVFRLVCRLLLIVLPKLACSDIGNEEPTELLQLLSRNAQINLQTDESGNLYEVTVESLTNTINVLTMMALERKDNHHILQIFIDTMTTELQHVNQVDGLLLLESS